MSFRNKEIQKAWHKKKRSEDPDYYRNKNLKQTYGITIKEFNKLLELQSGKCAICQGPPVYNGFGGGSVYHVDHCHETDKVRGLLCQKCNLGLGYFQDKELNILKATGYLMVFRIKDKIEEALRLGFIDVIEI